MSRTDQVRHEGIHRCPPSCTPHMHASPVCQIMRGCALFFPREGMAVCAHMHVPKPGTDLCAAAAGGCTVVLLCAAFKRTVRRLRGC